MIEIHGVTKRYGDVHALSNVSLTIGTGVTGLLGPNGSGKSTLIKTLLGLLRAQSGHGEMLGFRWPDQTRQIRDFVGYLPEDDCYIAGLTGIESVTLMARLSGLKGSEGLRRSHELLDFCGFGEQRYRGVEGYSTGMRQKLKFAQALVHDPKLLILDEPTTGLDPDERAAMLSRIRTLATRHGKSVILSTHILPDVRAVCDAVVILVAGTVRVVDTLANLSRPSEPTTHASVLGDSQPFVARLTALGYNVQSVGDGVLRIAGMSDGQLQDLWQCASETNTAIRAVEPAVNSLDKIFMEVATGAWSRSTLDVEPESNESSSIEGAR
jgi:ABC-2 type transport system ATP-binding protein